MWGKLRQFLDGLHRAALCLRPTRHQDTVELELPFIRVLVCRRGGSATPAEVTVVIPRMEVRTKSPGPSGEVRSTEVILNSVTVVHSPRHPLAGGGGSATPPAALVAGGEQVGTR